MSSKVGRQLKSRFAVPYACYKLISTRRSLIRQSGWIQSIRTSTPCSESGDPVPWMNYSMVELLEERLRKTHDVFEFGSGFSTCFFGQHCRQVVSVEYDRSWYDRVQELIPDNARVIFQPRDTDGDYCRAIAQCEQSFHVVVVDGQDRVNCIRQALGHLEPDGIVLLDDSDRADYQPGFAALADAGFKSLSIGGLKPGSPCRHQTTIFYRPDNCFGL
ncbi:class I SAM-dependent methyltransferase [Roseiconus nitratireducens]|uniref:Class I SAM-dependent methyltransferase n=1 Tax=Roseiconus nitratireducens TaxID=2605748 RepID=A0A5M6CVQ4_9BACT|nr:class I SAM-dependent methyltransferase [Roseiconus nitratireducens]KAA5539338.1 class I SAM-dependent methyltransferase [Roseiconus nitratireducens]